jgi:serine/threonine protein kinase
MTVSSGALKSYARHKILKISERIGMDDWLPDGFTVLERLGNGSFGRVELVQRDSDDYLFALKVLRDRGMKSADIEISALNLIDSPFVTKVYEVFRQPTYVSFLIDPALGGSLRQKISVHAESKRKLDQPELLNILVQLLLALEQIHNAGVVHRDFAPANILFVEQDPQNYGRVQVIDFGVSGILSQGELSGSHGTPLYMAPEVAAGSPHDSKADMYSLGVVLYEMSELTVPQGPGPVKLVNHPQLSDFVSRLLSPNPDERPSAMKCLRVKNLAAIAATFSAAERIVLTIRDYQPVTMDFSSINVGELPEPTKETQMSASGRVLSGTRGYVNDLKEQERITNLKARAERQLLAMHETEYKQRIEQMRNQKTERMINFKATHPVQPTVQGITPEEKAVDDLETTRMALEKRFGLEKLSHVHRIMANNPLLSPSELGISPLEYDQISRLLRREKEVYG